MLERSAGAMTTMKETAEIQMAPRARKKRAGIDDGRREASEEPRGDDGGCWRVLPA